MMPTFNKADEAFNTSASEELTMSDKFKTDLNERERARFAVAARNLQEQAGKLAEALNGGDDLKIAIEFMLLGLASGALKELQEVIL